MRSEANYSHPCVVRSFFQHRGDLVLYGSIVLFVNVTNGLSVFPLSGMEIGFFFSFSFFSGLNGLGKEEKEERFIWFLFLGLGLADFFWLCLVGQDEEVGDEISSGLLGVRESYDKRRA